MESDALRKDLFDRRYADTVRRLDDGEATARKLAVFSPDFLARVLRHRGRIRARLASTSWRSAAAGDMARRTERFLHLRAQYGHLSRDERRDLTSLYERFLAEAQSAAPGEGPGLARRLEDVTGTHLERLVAFVEGTAQGAVLGPAIRGEVTTVCAAYRPALQLAVLGIVSGDLESPVLDVGAGADGALVEWLRDRGLEAEGVDRLARGAAHVAGEDWFEFDPGRDLWGAILSHMAFTNHFLRHHRHGNPEAYRYATRYMVLLSALKVGGRFHYAPALPFMESLLPPGAFSVRHHLVPGLVVRDPAVSHATTVTRLH